MSTLDRDQILRLFSYHHWAEHRLFDAFGTVTAAQLDKPWGGSFSTGRGLLEHVVAADRIWLSRWTGNPITTRPSFPPSYDGKDFAAEWAKLASDEKTFLDARKAALDDKLDYVNLKGEAKSFAWFDIFIHVVNHGTYHRGQLSHLLRDLGLTPPSTDYILFIEAPQGKR